MTVKGRAAILRLRQDSILVAAVMAWLLLLTLPLPGGAANRTEAAATPDTAMELVRNTADRMLAVLVSKRAEIEASPQLIYGLVNEIVVPQFDFERITQYAMGRHWGQADADGRRAVIAAFQELLVRSYATALLSYSGQKIHVLHSRVRSGGDEVDVRTEVSDPRRSPRIPVDYKLHLKDGRWMAYDVVIDGVSLVANYRSSFDQEIRRGGIDALVEALESRNRQAGQS